MDLAYGAHAHYKICFEHVCCSLQRYSGEGSLEAKLPDSSRFTEIHNAIQAWRQSSSTDLTQVGQGYKMHSVATAITVLQRSINSCKPTACICDAKLEMPCMHD